ncbi:hypothetical protein DE8555_1493 [Neisseria meningitidis]|uniref:Uncharacterized protein n=1 Tax=Neisseria meningitidis TaxID=487 RepID=A0AAC9CR92_NEIME|nr:hypothetical protein DE8555_1493 [Neisseria meningitidis]ANW94140.1 hypothetical protein WUE2121_1506 [Neisseria meningitidis]
MYCLRLRRLVLIFVNPLYIPSENGAAGCPYGINRIPAG